MSIIEYLFFGLCGVGVTWCIVSLRMNNKAFEWHMLYTDASYELAIWMLYDMPSLYEKYGRSIQADIDACLIPQENLAIYPSYWIKYRTPYSIFQRTGTYEWSFDEMFMAVFWNKVIEAQAKRKGNI